jgi:ribosomal protein S18 acetylase RimI-like enzyme
MIKLLKTEHIQAAYDILDACRNHMNLHGIPQWNEHYPKILNVQNDIQKQEGFGYFSDDKLVGIIVLNDFQDAEYLEIEWRFPNEKVGVIHRLAVHPDFQGKGIAGQLMRFAEKQFSKQGYRSIRLDAFTKNPSALAMYDKMGYERRGQVYFPYRAIPFWCYEKKL